MVKTYKPNDFNRKCKIGVTKTVTTPTGGKIEKIDPATVLNVRFAAKMRSLALQFQIIGTTTADTFDIAIRHNKLVTKKMFVPSTVIFVLNDSALSTISCIAS